MPTAEPASRRCWSTAWSSSPSALSAADLRSGWNEQPFLGGRVIQTSLSVFSYYGESPLKYTKWRLNDSVAYGQERGGREPAIVRDIAAQPAGMHAVLRRC